MQEEACSICATPYVRSCLTHECLPLVEFQLVGGMSDAEVRACFSTLPMLNASRNSMSTLSKTLEHSTQAQSLLRTGSEAPLGSQRSSTASSQAGSSVPSSKAEPLDDEDDPFLSEVSTLPSYWPSRLLRSCTVHIGGRVMYPLPGA